MHQKNELYSVLEDWHKNIFPQLELRNINVDNSLTHEDIPLHDISKTKVNDGHMGLYGWKHIIQQTKVILEDLIQDVVNPKRSREWASMIGVVWGLLGYAIFRYG